MAMQSECNRREMIKPSDSVLVWGASERRPPTERRRDG